MNSLNDSNRNHINLKEIAKTAVDPCVHCGFCLPTCASYKVLGTEMDSPRGRIHTLKAIDKGELELDQTIAKHFDTCLGCYACVTACPSGVRYDQLLEITRPKLNQSHLRSSCKNALRKLLLELLPYPKRLKTVLRAIRNYTGSPLQKMIRQFGLTKLLGPQLTAMEALLPKLEKKNLEDNFEIINQPHGHPRGRVGLVLGCVQRCFDPMVNEATIKVLQANGIEVIVPKDQGCCGAVAHHQGEINQTQELARELLRSFSDVLGPNSPAGEKPLDALLIAASGCGHTMKAYKEILGKENNPINQTPVLDVHEFLTNLGLSNTFIESLKPLNHSEGRPSTKDDPFAVVYHDACHMIHGQGISSEPRNLLKHIPYLALKEVKEPGVCCGSAGIYNIVQPTVAEELGNMKVNELKQTMAELIASPNIGCTLQIRRYLTGKVQVAHPMQLLAYSAGLHQAPSF